MATSALTTPQRRPRLGPLATRAALGGAVLVASLGLTAAAAGAAPAAGDAPSATRTAVVGTAGTSSAPLSRMAAGAALKGPVVTTAQTIAAPRRLADELQVAATGPVATRLHLSAARPLPAGVSVGPAPSAAVDAGAPARSTAAAVATGLSRAQVDRLAPRLRSAVSAALAHLLAARSALISLADTALAPPGATPAAPGTAVVPGVEPGQRAGTGAATSWRAADEAVRALPAAVQRGVEQAVQSVQAVAEVGVGATEREAGWAQQPGRGSLVGQSAAIMSLLAACGLVAAATVGRRQEATRS